ncbi:MAG: DUF4836 family protein [Raineya sp.]
MSACGGKKSPEHTKLIPKSAFAVVRLDVKQLTSKTVSLDKLASEENLQQMGASKKEAEKASKNIKKFLDSGIDFLNTIYLFSDETEKKSKSFGLTFAIDNEDKFAKFIKDDAFWKESDGAKKPEFKEEGKIKFAIFDDKESIIAWQGKSGVLLSKPNNSTANLKKLFETKESETLLSNANFKEFASKPYDVSVWLNLEKTSKLVGMLANAAMGIVGISDKDTYLIAGLNFEKGKMNIDTDYIGNESINKINDKIANNNISSDLTKNIPVAKPSTGFSFALNLEGILQVAKEKGILGELERSLKDLDIQSEDLSKALTGDGFGVTSRVNFDAKRGDIPVDFIVSLGVKDKKAFESLMDKLNENTGKTITKEGDVYIAPMNMGYLVLKDKVAYITLDSKLKDGIKEGKNELKGELKDNAGKYASVIYIGKEFFDALASSKNYQKEVLGKEFPLESVLFVSEKMKNNKSKSQLKIEMSDKSKNSLLTLIDLGKRISEEQEKQRKKWQEEFKIDERPEDEESVLEEK